MHVSLVEGLHCLANTQNDKDLLMEYDKGKLVELTQYVIKNKLASPKIAIFRRRIEAFGFYLVEND